MIWCWARKSQSAHHGIFWYCSFFFTFYAMINSVKSSLWVFAKSLFYLFLWHCWLSKLPYTFHQFGTSISSNSPSLSFSHDVNQHKCYKDTWRVIWKYRYMCIWGPWKKINCARFQTSPIWYFFKNSSKCLHNEFILSMIYQHIN